MPVRKRAVVAAFLSATLVATLPSSVPAGAAVAREAWRPATVAVVGISSPPTRIVVNEPTRTKPPLFVPNVTRANIARSVRPAFGARVAGPPMLRPGDVGRVVEAARRAVLTHTQRAPAQGFAAPSGVRRASGALAPQAIQNCTPATSRIRRPATVVASPPPDNPTPTPCPNNPTPTPVGTPAPTPTPAPAPIASSGTGINSWWRYQEESVPGGGRVMVNVGTGNLMLQDDDMAVPHKGIALAFRRTYNSQNAAANLATTWGTWQSLYGNGWTNTFDARFVSQSPTIKSVYDIDGARYDYFYNASTGIMTSLTPGQHATMVFDGHCGWLWTKKSGTTYYFYTMNPNAPVSCPALSQIGGYSGRLYQIIGRNTNTTLTFNYSWDNGDASINGKVSAISVQTESGLTATLSFADINGRRLLQTLTFPDGATSVAYGYDAQGNLQSVTRPANNAAGTRPIEMYGSQTIGADSVLLWVASPRLVASCATSCYLDGGYLQFGFTGSGAASSTVSSIIHAAVVNPIVPDGTNSGALQSGYATRSYPYLTEYFTTGGPTATMRDTDGHMTNWVVDGTGRPTQTQECTASVSQGQQCTGTWLVTNAYWDADNNLTREVDVRGAQTDYTHDPSGNTIAAARPTVTVSTRNGLATFRPTDLYDYDGNNNVTAYCDATATHSSGNDWSGSGPAVSDNLCSTAASGTPHATFAFTATPNEPFGELTTITSALGYTRHIAYNPSLEGGADFGLPTDVYGDTITQADGTSRQPYNRYTYDANGNVVCFAANANNQSTVHALSYDALNRVLAVADPDDSSAGGCSRTPGLPGSSIVSRTKYFPDGSKASTQSPSEAAKNVATQYTYDLDGNETSEVHHFGDVAGTTTKWYDGIDRLIEVSQPSTSTDPLPYPWMTRYLYDLSSQGTSGSLPSVNGVAIAAYGNLFKTVEYMPPTTLGMPTSNNPPTWVDVRGTAFDALDRRTASYEAAFGSAPKEALTYDAGGQRGLLTQVANAMGQVKSMAYDSLGRPLSETYSGDNGLTPNRSFIYDVSGKPSSITTADLGTETYTFDAEGRETSKLEPASGAILNPGTIGHLYYGDGMLKSTTIGASSFAIPVSIDRSYRADGSLKTETLNDINGKHTFAWTYTGGGRITQRSDPLTGASVSSTTRGGITLVPQTYTYDPAGQLLTMTLPRNNTYSSMLHDAEAETTDFDAYQDRPSVSSWHQSMTYTIRGELGTEAVQQSQSGKSGRVLHGYAFGVDFGRGSNGDFRNGATLIRHPSQNLTVQYQYDAAGRLQTSTSAATLTSGPYTATANGSFTRAYDANNHLRSETVAQSYVNALDGCCASANTEVPMTLSYWPDGHAAAVASDPFTGTLHWDGDQLLYTGNMVFVGTDALISTQQGYPATLVYDRDWAGDAVSSHWAYGGTTFYGAWSDKNVSVQWGKAGPDGNYPAPSSGNDNTAIPTDMFPVPQPNRTDGYTIAQTTLQGVRAYDAAAGQFMTPDAYAGDVHDPMSQKPFMWNRNNPYEYSDPSGYDPLPDFRFRLGPSLTSSPSGFDPKVINVPYHATAGKNGAAHGKIIGGVIATAAALAIPGGAGVVEKIASVTAGDAVTKAGEMAGEGIGSLAGYGNSDPGPVPAAEQNAYDNLSTLGHVKDGLDVAGAVAGNALKAVKKAAEKVVKKVVQKVQQH